MALLGAMLQYGPSDGRPIWPSRNMCEQITAWLVEGGVIVRTVIFGRPFKSL
jgi:hypothetical protein